MNEHQPQSITGAREIKHMGKWVSLTLVGVVIATITGMWFMFDRAQGRPAVDAALGRGGSVSASATTDDPMDALKQRVKQATDQAKQAGEKAVDDAKKAVTDAAQGVTMVDPESLPQGFVVVVVDKAKKASRESPIHMASSHNGWNPGDPSMKLEPQSDMKWRIDWSKPKLNSRIAFKFTRGSWEQVESKDDFTDIDNRLLPQVDISKLKAGEKPVIELEVLQWKDNRPYDASKDPSNRYRAISVSAGTLQRLEVVGGVQAGLKRDLLVWLPPGYDAPENAQKSYPVLYMADGQNLFEKIGTLPAEWGVDETASKLISEGKIEPLIVVGIPHAGGLRISEYSPVEVVDGQPAKGPQFVEWLRGHVMPRVERAFRVQTGPQHTAIGGASMGGLIALEAGTSHPEVFGKVLAESTPLTRKDRSAFRHFGTKAKWPERVYFGMGGRELPNDAGASKAAVESAKAFAELAAGKGLTGDRFLLSIDEQAEHTEAAWAKRLPAALMYLYGKPE